MDKEARGKPGPAGIVGVLRNSKGEIMLLFSKNVGVKESNEAKVLMKLEALLLFLRYYQVKLIVERDSAIAVMWASYYNSRPWRLQFLFMRSKSCNVLLMCLFAT